MTGETGQMTETERTTDTDTITIDEKKDSFKEESRSGMKRESREGNKDGRRGTRAAGGNQISSQLKRRCLSHEHILNAGAVKTTHLV